MAESRLTVRFEGVSGLSSAAAATRDGAVQTVLPAALLAETGIETVGAAELFELDPPTLARGGEWAGRSGTVEISSPIERDVAELLLVRCGTTGYRVLTPAGGKDRLVYRLPVTPGPGSDRGPLAGAVRWLVQKVVVPIAGDLAGSGGEHLIRRWEAARRPGTMRFFTPRLYQTAKAEPADPHGCGNGRLLVLLHGLNGQSHDRNGLGAMPRDLVEELNRQYTHVLAYDHPTLTLSPAANAEALARWLADAKPSRVDFLCHSRGGLVARHLVERMETTIRVGTVVFLGTPHQGTPVASADHLGRLVDRLLTLAMAVPDNPVTIAVEGALTVAKELAANVYDHLDGVRAMRPIGDGDEGFLATLATEAPDGVTYRAVASDFEAAPGSGWWHAWRDQGIDLVFGGLPNDAIVPTFSALQLGEQPGSGFAEMVVFDDLDSVMHSRYFSSPMVPPVIRSWLGRDPAPQSEQLRSRIRTPEEVRTLAALGPEWGLARKVADLACLAPSATRPALGQLGAKVWEAATGGRGDGECRPTVVLLPGIMGSELQVGGRRVWLSPWQLAQGGIDRLRLPDAAGEVRATEMLCFAYRTFLEHFRNSCDVVVEFPYDWRRSLDDAARSFVRMLTGLVADRTDTAPVHIVAHSMGALVVRRARQLAAGDADPFAALGGEIVLVGPPNHGTFAAPLLLNGCHPLVRNLARLDVRNGRGAWLEMLWTFPGLVQLLPDPAGVAVGDEAPAPLGWLYEPERWAGLKDPDRVRQALAAASSFHDELRRADGTSMHVVLGSGLTTPVGVRALGADRFEVEVAKDGDGTVSVACGRLSGAATYFAPGTAHGDLVRDAKVLTGIDEILRGKRPSGLRSAEDGTSRGALVDARPEGRWLDPADAETELDGTGAGSRSGTASAVLPTAWTRRGVMTVGMEAVSGLLTRPDVQEIPDLAISVVHGSLESASYPVLVGHATGTPIAGAEARCDAMLGGELSTLHVLGNYPHWRGGFLYVPKTRPDQRIEGCIIVALDSTTPLSTAELGESVCRALVDFAERRRWEGLLRHGADDAAGDVLSVSTVPLGSGAGLSLGLERAVDAVVSGVQRANAILRAADRPTIRRLEFVERYAARVERIMWTLQRLQDRVNASSVPGRIDLGERLIQQKDGALEGTPPPSYESGRWERLSVDVVGTAKRDDEIRRLKYQFARDRAAVSDRPRRVDRRVVAELLKEAVARPSRSIALGAVLFEELLPAELKDELARADNLVLQVDALTADVPWELLVDRLAGDEPLACRAGLLRQFRTSDLSSRTSAGVASTALVFGDPPTDLVPLPGARQEAREVWELMRIRQLDVQFLQFDDQTGEVRSSASRIKEAFRARDHRIIHIAAHGLYRVAADETDKDPEGPRIDGGVAIGDGAFLTADDFANLRVAPDLVFLNCCHLGRARLDEQGGLLDPVDQHQAAASIAKRLMDIGVRAVVVAGWAVDDAAGRSFAKEFYRGMLDGVPFGDAVRNARVAVYRQSEQANNTWAAYQCYGDPGFQLAPPQIGADVGREPPVRAAARRQLEELYVRAGETADVSAVVDDLTALDADVVRRWPVDGDLIAQCGQVWGDLGRYDKAIARYVLAAECEGGASLTTIEQLVNLSARRALELWRDQADPDEIAAALHLGRRWLRVMRRLPATSERRSIAASFAKRMAVLQPERWRTHVGAAIASYVESAELSKERSTPDGRNLYGFLNALQLAALVDDGAAAVRSIVTIGWVKRWIKDLTTEPSRDGSFWEFVAPADSALTAALVPAFSQLDVDIKATAGTLEGDAAAGVPKLRQSLSRGMDGGDGDETVARIAASYLAPRSRARIRHWKSVVENVELLRDLARVGKCSSADGLADLARRLEQSRR